MAGSLRGRRPHRGTHPRGTRGHQVAGHPRNGPHGAENPCGRHSRHFGNGVRRPLPGPVEVHLHHRLERQDHYHVARLQDHARRRDERRPGRQHRREFRLLRGHGRLRLVRAGIKLVPARRHVQVPRPHRRADEHHARPPRPLRTLFPELRRFEDAHHAEPELARLFRLFGRRRGDLAAASQVRPAHEATSLRRKECRGERCRRRLPLRRQIHGGRREGLGRDRHGQDAAQRAAQCL